MLRGASICMGGAAAVRLRTGRRELLENVLPTVSLPEGDAPLEPERLFEHRPAEVWLEIGFGGGEHLAEQAAEHPDVGLIGCEPYLPGVASALRQITQRNLRNVRIVAGDARPVLARLPAGSLSRAFILFPDPWPKARHHRRRIVSRSTLDRLAALLRPGAELRVATDDPDYLCWILAEVLEHPAFEWPATGPDDWRRRPPDWPPTRYEQKAVKQGRRPTYLRFRRGSPA